MPISLEIGSLILGGVLLLIATVGGRFKLFGAEISGEAGRLGRVFAGAVGIALIFPAAVASISSPATSLPDTTPSSGASGVSRAASCGEGRSAFEASNDCYIAYKAHDIRAAEAACNEGLAKARCTGDRNVEGMVLFNLGLCAETRSDWQTAHRFYQESLSARQNQAVQKRLSIVELRMNAP